MIFTLEPQVRGSDVETQDFRAMVVRESAGAFLREITRRRLGDLPAGEVLIRVGWSSLNYKDALAASGARGVARSYPHTPGIDAAGTVVRSLDQSFAAGSQVIVTGYGLGTDTSGGFAEFIRVPAGWVVPLPGNLSLREAMTFGSAGFTAAQCVERLQALGVKPGAGEVLVTGASGGLGSFAVALLARSGYRVSAATGKTSAADYLRGLGAEQVLPRSAVLDTSDRPLLKRRWAAAVDTVGGPILATVLRSVEQGGAVAACGNAASPSLSLTVYPFILRGITLSGIDSAFCPMPERRRIWARLAGEWKLAQLPAIASECALEQLPERIERMLAGGITGRVVVRLD
jgi:acrylyl-CoA reductase (NADPH)